MDVMLYALLAIGLVEVALAATLLAGSHRPSELAPATMAQIAAIARIVEAMPAAYRDEARATREEARPMFAAQTDAMEKRFEGFETRLAASGRAQAEHIAAMRTEAADGRAKTDEAAARGADTLAKTLSDRLRDTGEAIATLADRMTAAQRDGREEQRIALEGVVAKMGQLNDGNEARQEALRATLATSLDGIRTDNGDKLERIRATVEEKLQGTLEKRLGESFQLVSDRLEAVHKGLGEMQTLATGVGDLKRVLSNVKSRGGWGEVQLGMILGDILTAEQFEANAKINPESDEMVEYAVRLPGRSDDNRPILLPIDAKFPSEDYERLVIAQEAGLVEEMEKAGQAIERAIRLQAKTIAEKYVHPPHSTDFAIMYLPTEGLFAEVIRRPGLASELQTKHRVLIQGPTTLAALLNSLQMGFRTLAIERRSSEVWQILGAAKAEFEKYGQVWDKLAKQLETAKRTVDEAGKRTRAVTRRLRDVETLEAPGKPAALDLLSFADREDEDMADAAD